MDWEVKGAESSGLELSIISEIDNFISFYVVQTKLTRTVILGEPLTKPICMISKNSLLEPRDW